MTKSEIDTAVQQLVTAAITSAGDDKISEYSKRIIVHMSRVYVEALSKLAEDLEELRKE